MLRAVGEVRVLRPDRRDRKLRLLMVTAELEDVWRDMRAPLTSFLARRVSDPRDAEDVLQEVMLRIHRHAGEIDRVEHLGAWVHRVAQSAVVDLYRRRAARPELPAGSGADVAESQPLPGRDYAPPEELRRELAACLAPLLRRLPDKHREALELTEFDGLSQVAAADRLGLSKSGMKARVQRARGQLRDLLLECCHIELDRRGGIAAYRTRRGGCPSCNGAPSTGPHRHQEDDDGSADW